MISDENAIEISQKLPLTTNPLQKSEYFSGKLYDEEATLHYQPIHGTKSAQETMAELLLNKDEHPGVIKLLGYKPDRLDDGDFLIKIYEPFLDTVESATEKGLIWSEPRLFRTLIDLCGAGKMLTLRGIRHARIWPRHLLVTSQEGRVKLPLTKQKPPAKERESPFTAPEIVSGERVMEVGLADVYSLGASLAYMCLRSIPTDILAGTCTWSDYIPEISLQYPLISSILPKFLSCDQRERYNFSHFLSILRPEDGFALIRMNEIVKNREIQAKNREIRAICRVIGQGFENIEVVKRKYLVCRSCKAREIDIHQLGFTCTCGSLNLR